MIRSVHAVLRPSGLYWLMCFSEHATFPGPRRLTQQHIATLFAHATKLTAHSTSLLERFHKHIH